MKRRGSVVAWLAGATLFGCDSSPSEAPIESTELSDDDGAGSSANDAGYHAEAGARDGDPHPRGDHDASPADSNADASATGNDGPDDDGTDADPSDDAEEDGFLDAGTDAPAGSNAPTCALGELDCVCYPNETCNGEFRCDLGICRSPLVDAGDVPNCVGEAGCACYPNLTCNLALTCVAGTCADDPLGSGGAEFGGAGSGGAAQGGMLGLGGEGNQGGSAGVPPEDGRTATVVVLLDRSTSMFSSSLPSGGGAPVGDYPDAWEAARAAVASLEPFADQVAFGAVTFNELGSDACPFLQGTELTPELGSFEAVKDLTPPSEEAIPESKAGTPLREGLQAGYALLDAVSSSAPKVLLFIGDGSAEMCGVLDRGAYCGSDPAVGVVQDAYARGIVTLAFGIGGSMAGDEAPAASYLLNAVAHAGRGLPVAPNPALDQWRPCLQLEYPAITGDEVGDDFWDGENWRQYAQGSYGDAAFDQDLYVAPNPDDVDVAMQDLMNEVVLSL